VTRRPLTPEKHIYAAFSMLPEPYSQESATFAIADSIHANLQRRTVRWLKRLSAKKRSPTQGLEDDLRLFQELDESGVLIYLPDAFHERAKALSDELVNGEYYADDWEEEEEEYYDD
tara:strand:+ start:1036 stop:1386 length:351 start_codon:yes stop_codon:yes gene_type:complete